MRRSLIGVAAAAWVFAVVACSSFGADEPDPTSTSEAGATDGPGAGNGDGGADADTDGAIVPDAAPCTRTVTNFGLGKLTKHEDGSGRVVLGNTRLIATVGSDAGASTGHAYGSLDIGPNPSSITMSYRFGSRGIDGAYAELGCMADLFPTANDTPVTSIYLAQEKSREVVFLIDRDTGTELFRQSLGTAGTNLNESDVTLALASIGASRLLGSLTVGSTSIPFDVPLTAPVVRATVYCGVYYAETSDAGSFPTDTQNFAGTACSD